MEIPYSHWKTPSIWKDRTAYIIGGGPSILDQDLALIKTKRVIGCNDAYTLGSWIDLCYFGDWKWFVKHWRHTITRPDGSTHPGLKKYKGIKVTSNSNLSIINIPQIKVLKRMRSFCSIPGAIYWGSNTGVSSINLAYNLGCRRMVLLGFDMTRIDNETHWHDPIEIPEAYPYDRHPKSNIWIDSFNKVEEVSESLNFKVYNASPISKLESFEKIKYEDAVNAFR